MPDTLALEKLYDDSLALLQSDATFGADAAGAVTQTGGGTAIIANVASPVVGVGACLFTITGSGGLGVATCSWTALGQSGTGPVTQGMSLGTTGLSLTLAGAPPALVAATTYAWTVTSPARARVAFGRKAPPRQHALEARIVYVPGDDSASVGELGAAKYPGNNPRSIATLNEAFRVYLDARDASAPTDDRTQWKAARLLFDAWYRTVFLVAEGTIQVRAVKWRSERAEGHGGDGMIVTCVIGSKVPDAPDDEADVDTGVILDVENGSTIEELIIPEGHVPS